mgnify:FL=1
MTGVQTCALPIYRNYSLWVNWQGYFHFSIADVNNVGYSVNSPLNLVTTNTWYHVVATYDGGFLKLFVNGKQVGATIMTAQISVQTPGNGITAIDAYNNGTVKRLDGNLADFAIYNTALPASNIQQHFTSSDYYKNLTTSATGDDPYAVQIKADNPTFWWRLGDATGSTVAIDSSTTRTYNGTASNVSFGATASPTRPAATAAGFTGSTATATRSSISLADNINIRGANTAGNASASWSLEAWVNVSYLDGSTGSIYQIMGKGKIGRAHV